MRGATMKLLKNIIHILFWLFIIALLVLPLVLIVRLSQEERASYAAPTAPQMQELAVGGIVQSHYGTATETVSVSGTFVSVNYEYMELDYESVKDARWQIRTADELQVGQVIAETPQGEIQSSLAGVVSEMHISQSDCYIKVQLLSPVELSCRVESRTLSILQTSKNLKVDGKTVTLTYVSQLLNADGTTDVRLSIDGDDYTCGQVVSNLDIATGRSFDNVVMLLERCVYQKAGFDQYYVRRVTTDGIFIEEIQVEVLFQNGNQVGLRGIEAGDYFDAGYKAVAGG